MTQEEIDETVAAIKAHGKKLLENKKEAIRVMVELGLIEEPPKTNTKKKTKK